MQTVRTTTELHARAAHTLLDYYQGRERPGICRCGTGSAYGPSTTRAQHAAEEQFRVTPKEVTRC